MRSVGDSPAPLAEPFHVNSRQREVFTKNVKLMVIVGIVACLAAWATGSAITTTSTDKAAIESLAKCDPTPTPPPEPKACETPLLAGQDTPVGMVIVTWFDDYVRVEYQITENDWFITEVHVYVGLGPPKKPSPGKFDYEEEDLWTQNYQLDIPRDELPPGCTFATHAVVATIVDYESDLEGLEDSLPDQVTMWVQHPGGDSYFNVTVMGGTSLDGVYDDWCIDTDSTISPGAGNIYTANVYSSYEDITGLVEYPDNMDLVNWIINEGFVGQPSPGCGGNYTYGDVQRAIWALIEDTQSTSGLGSWSQCRVDEILAAAYASGEGFVPDCEDVVAVILVPVNGAQITIAQVTFAEVEVPCIPILWSETAWGWGEGQFDKGWGWYFDCCE